MKLHGSIAASAALVLAGCHSTSNPAEDNAVGAAYSDNLVDNVAVDDAADQTDVAEVVEVPVPASTTAAEAAPLVEAASVSSAISSASDVERVPYDGGWAWRRNGQIVRTASRDGRRVSYFRAGQTSPFLVQDGDRAYAFSGGKLERGYDEKGRAVAVDSSHRQSGEQLARRSSQERSDAIRVASEQPSRVQPARPSGHETDAARNSRSDATPVQDRNDRQDATERHDSSQPQSRATPQTHDRSQPRPTATATPRGDHLTSGRSGDRSSDDRTKLGPRADQPLPAATDR